MTRPKSASERFIAALPDDIVKAVRILISPLIQIEGLAHQELPDFDSAIFTSSNGVAFAPDGHGRRAYCVGPATTKAATAKGWTAVQTGHDASDLIDYLARHPDTGALCHFAGRHTRGDIVENLTACGMTANRVQLYDQTAKPLSPEALQVLGRENAVIVPLFSPRTALQFARTAARAKAPLFVGAISDAAAEPVRALDVEHIEVASAPSHPAMERVVRALLRRAQSA